MTDYVPAPVPARRSGAPSARAAVHHPARAGGRPRRGRAAARSRARVHRRGPQPVEDGAAPVHAPQAGHGQPGRVHPRDAAGVRRRPRLEVRLPDGHARRQPGAVVGASRSAPTTSATTTSPRSCGAPRSRSRSRSSSPLLATVLGVLIGAISGYFRGWVDTGLMRFVDLLLTIPLLAIAAVPRSHARRRRLVHARRHPVGLCSWTTHRPHHPRRVPVPAGEGVRRGGARPSALNDRRIIFKHIAAQRGRPDHRRRHADHRRGHPASRRRCRSSASA